MKIGITLGLKDNKESIWTNGIKQNVLILVNLLKKSSKNYGLKNKIKNHNYPVEVDIAFGKCDVMVEITES
jgi:hypothetical protein